MFGKLSRAFPESENYCFVKGMDKLIFIFFIFLDSVNFDPQILKLVLLVLWFSFIKG